MTKKTPEKSTAVAVKDDYAVSKEFAGKFDSSLSSAGDSMDSSDFRIPKLTLIQAMTKSTFNTEGVAVGSFVNSIDKDDMGSTIDMFVMTDIKLWQWDYNVKKGNDTKKEYLTITNFADSPNARESGPTPEVLEKMERKEVKEVQMLKPDLIYRFYVLLPSEVKEGVAFPYIVDFKRSSAQEGNKLKNIFFKMKKLAKVPSYAKVFTMTSEFVQDEFDYYIKKVNGGRKISDEELGAVEGWIKELSQNASNYEADESDNDADTATATVVDAEVVNKEDNTNQPKF